MYEDKTLVCKDCNQEFTFTAGEQEFYAEKGFQNEPGRCPTCRSARKEARNNRGYGERQMYEAVCDSCGATCQVPFQPSGDKPVYCRDCFQARKAY